jgi:glyoxylase-like metal-dependent hydrolase (beta-lactamase superfamily II)
VSEFVQTNSVIVESGEGVLLIDPGIHRSELECLIADLAVAGQAVIAGFSTHPHWDHLLWHSGLGSAPRYATSLAAATATSRLAGGIDAARAGIPDDVPLELIGQLTGLPDGAEEIPWDGTRVRILEHNAHASGHAALLIDESGVLIAGDMLSDGLIPMLDAGADDPFADYLAALDLLEDAARGAEFVIPGHGSVATAVDAQDRIGRDRAYVTALRDGGTFSDDRIGTSARPGWEWVADVHAGQVQRFAAEV